MRGCLTSLGNDEILELFALNAKIVEIVFNLGLSNPPAHPPNPPNPPVPDRRSPDPTAPRVGHGSRVPKPDAGGSVSSSLVQNP